MALPTDPGVLSVLTAFGVADDEPLGHGGEAWVYALGHDRVLRVLHNGGSAEDIGKRRQLVDELRQARPAFALPEILEVGEIDGRVFALERRLPGRSVLEAMHFAQGAERRHLVEHHLDTAAALGDLHLETRDSFGDLMAGDPIATATWREYLAERAAANLARSTREFWAIDAGALAEELPEPTGPAFVHLDAFVGNMLTDGTRITAVIDFGATSVAGDRRLDPLAAAVYLAEPVITPPVTTGDIDVVMGWLRAADLDQWFDPARRWLAAYWSFVVDQPTFLHWCRRVLLGHQ